MIQTLYEHKNLLWVLTFHDFRSQYLGSIMGFLWSVIKPLALISVYAFVFSSMMSPTEDLTDKQVNLGLYIFAGMLPWMAIQDSVQRGATVFLDNAPLIRHHIIPLYFLPLQIVLSATLSKLMATIVFLIVKGIILKSVTVHCCLIIAFVPLQIMFCFGLSLIVSTLTVFINDVSHFAITVLFVWFFASPIIFPLEMMPSYMQQIMWINPLTWITQVYRSLLLFGEFPSLTESLCFCNFSIIALI